MNARLALAAAVLILAGCDRFEEAGGGPPPAGPPAAPSVTVRDVYVKGTSALGLGQSSEFRTESVEGAAFYRWTAQGTGGIAFTASPADVSGLGRIVTLGGAAAGPVVVEATALDAQRRVIARGTRSVTVR